MNEKISQLTKKSGLILYRTKDIYNWEYAVEDFAALIVKECIDILKPCTISGQKFDNDHLLIDLKKHFGIEE
jgi:hypothetical protein